MNDSGRSPGPIKASFFSKDLWVQTMFFSTLFLTWWRFLEMPMFHGVHTLGWAGPTKPRGHQLQPVDLLWTCYSYSFHDMYQKDQKVFPRNFRLLWFFVKSHTFSMAFFMGHFVSWADSWIAGAVDLPCLFRWRTRIIPRPQPRNGWRRYPSQSLT